MRRHRDTGLSKLFAKGQELETSISTSSIFSKDNGLHLMSYKVVSNKKSTVIDNISIYGSTILVLEAKNYTRLSGGKDMNFWKGKGLGRQFSLPNPIKQNKYHIKLLGEYLVDKGISVHEFIVEHYIVVPDKCVVDVGENTKSYIMSKSQLDTYKAKLSFYNPNPNKRLERIIKEGLI